MKENGKKLRQEKGGYKQEKRAAQENRGVRRSKGKEE